MDQIERNYRALLSVALVLNSQRDMRSLWEAITVEITKAIPWARASITLYDPQADAFRFYVLRPQSRWSRLTAMPSSRATEAGWDGYMNTKPCTFALISRKSESFLKTSYMSKKASDG